MNQIRMLAGTTPLIVATLCLSIGCHKHRNNDPPKPPQDFTPPTWNVVELKIDPACKVVTKEEVAWQIDQVTRCWLRYYENVLSKELGVPYLPRGFPTLKDGPQQVRVWIQKTCATSGDGPWKDHGKWGLWIKCWSCTRSEQFSKGSMLELVQHWFSHELTGLSDSEKDHKLIAETCGC